MKRLFVPLLALAIIPLQSLADFRVYGKANVSLQHADETGNSKVELVSNASRLGVKGSDELSEGLEAIYQFEYQTFIDDGEGAGQTFTQRDIYVGVRGHYGTLIAGKVNTPVKSTQDKVDLFNDLEGDINYLFAGELRANNVVQYKSPLVADYFSGSVAYIASEVDGVDAGISAAGHFRNQSRNLYLSLGVDQDVQEPETGSDLVRLVVRYSLSQIHIGALLESYDDGVVDEEGVLMSVLWEASEFWSFKAQAGSAEDESGRSREQFSLGADYKLSDRAKLFSYYTNESIDPDCTDEGCDGQYLGAGVSLSF